jgi:hypothetical protein
MKMLPRRMYYEIGGWLSCQQKPLNLTAMLQAMTLTTPADQITENDYIYNLQI